MFMLTAIEDNVRVDPSQLGGPASIAVEEQIKKLYFDKVIKNVGLVVSLYDITSIEGGDVQVGDGGVRFTAKFRLIIFRPFEGELLLGRINVSSEYVLGDLRIESPEYQGTGRNPERAGCRYSVAFTAVIRKPGMLLHVCRHGIIVSLGFTEDVFIPERYMQTPGSMYDATQRSWFWKYDGGDPLWLSADEVIRFKVREVIFKDKMAQGDTEGAPDAPMLLIGDIDGDGLGCVSWWDNKDDDDEDGDEEMQE